MMATATENQCKTNNNVYAKTLYKTALLLGSLEGSHIVVVRLSSACQPEPVSLWNMSVFETATSINVPIRPIKPADTLKIDTCLVVDWRRDSPLMYTQALTYLLTYLELRSRVKYAIKNKNHLNQGSKENSWAARLSSDWRKCADMHAAAEE